MRIGEWIPGFMMEHVITHKGFPWPDVNSNEFTELTRVWMYQFIKHGITPEVAREASYGLAGIEHKLSDHLPTFLRVCQEIFKRVNQGTLPPIAPDPLRDATLASSDCRDCAGSGWATRWIHQSIYGKLNNAQGNPIAVGCSVAIPCGCALGKLIASHTGHRLTIDQYPSLKLQSVPWSSELDCKYRYRPRQWDDATNQPITPVDIKSLDDLKQLVARLAGERRIAPEPSGAVGGTIYPPDRRESRHEASRALPRDTDDPILRAELNRMEDPPSRRAAQPPPDLTIPEDDWTQWP
jgi:hypothetical protein